MGKKLNRIYQALVEGAAEGLADKALYDNVTSKCPGTPGKRIVKAALLALTDPDVRDRDMLERIYALAIDYRMSSLGVENQSHEGDDDDAHAPVVSKKLRSRLETSVSTLSAVQDSEADVTESMGGNGR
jgi:hypothetical protein